MPELPEVETIAKGLKCYILNKKITDFKCSKPSIINNIEPKFKKIILDTSIKKILRHGKYLFLELENSNTIVVHLRMTGQIFIVPKKERPDKHTHLEFIFENSAYKLIYRDIRQFGRFEIIKTNQVNDFIKRKKLASDAITIKYKEFQKNLFKKNNNIKTALLDQSVIAGLGNIYADEVLFIAKINPLTNVQKIDQKTAKNLLKIIKEILAKAIEKKGTSFSDYINAEGKKGEYQFELKVYNRENKKCYSCESIIKKEKINGRSASFCPKCQKLS